MKGVHAAACHTDRFMRWEHNSRAVSTTLASSCLDIALRYSFSYHIVPSASPLSDNFHSALLTSFVGNHIP